MASYLDRSISLVGEEALKKMQEATILVIGLGGVGGTALEALARSGFKHFLIVDNDKVDVTNLNRQIMYLNDDIGELKVDVCKKRLKAINPNIKVETFSLFINEETIEKFNDMKIDYIVDAIDKVMSKVAILKFAAKRNIPVISSMGMGKRLDPSKVFVTTLNKTEGDPLAKKLRQECKKANIDLKKIKAVCSKEEPINNEVTIASMMMVPSMAGLAIASEIINYYK